MAAFCNDGSHGVVAIDAPGLLTMGNISTNGIGFRAGGVRSIAAVTAPNIRLSQHPHPGSGGMQGEGISGGTPARTNSVATGP